MPDRDSFGSFLRRARERRGVSLEDIAQRTKVSVDLWAALERGDLSRWPSGIFARAFVREYAEAVDLDPVGTVDEFCRVFPHGDRRAAGLLRAHGAIVGHDTHWEDDLVGHVVEKDRRRRVTEEEPAAPPRARAWQPNYGRLVATLVDAGGVLAVAAAVAWLLRLDVWATVAATGLVWNTAGVYRFGATLGAAAIAGLGRLTQGAGGTRAILTGRRPAPTDA